ncbi:PREDICTED: pumilio homolog 12-like [Lupinus angustifolius]|uniref:pumilio homolog 12-like n=1 Tax=Lupinus angustifolius TaxID=3871 RepID=UPI00092F8CAA|nr:PREDICTED: pumilio homolog 12-like [Lupinus angustifolius]
MKCVDIATDKKGCSVIQKCMEHALPDAIVPLVQAIIYNAALLAEDPYGNYVVQYLVEMEIVKVNGMIISELGGKYVQLSRNKHASNVVQNLLKYSEERDSMTIILELMNSTEFFSVLQDPYGNYVAQTALENSKGYLHKRMLDSILTKYRDLCNHFYGKKVLAFVEKRLRIQF